MNIKKPIQYIKNREINSNLKNIKGIELLFKEVIVMLICGIYQIY